MKQVVEDVLQAEEKAGALLRQARIQASEMRRVAEREASEKLVAAKEQARELMQTALEEERQAAEGMRAEMLEQADRDQETLLNGHAETIARLVEDICGIIVRTESEKVT